MIRTILLTILLCALATAAMAIFLLMIPKFGATHFGAPKDIQEMVREMPDLPIRAGWDTVHTDMNFGQVFLRFVIMLEGYKLYDIVFFDYLMLTKTHFIEKKYSALKGAKGFDSYGFNAKSQIQDIVLFPLISVALATACIYVF